MAAWESQISKLRRKKAAAARRKRTLYDENGILIEMGEDLCDCLDKSCPGCHFPCPKCKSSKCGTKCRVYRKWIYEKITIEGDRRQTNSNPK